MDLKKNILSRLLLRVKTLGLAKVEYRSTPQFWELTDAGKALIEIGIEGNQELRTLDIKKETYQLREHDLLVRFPILRKPEGFEKELMNKGWTGNRRASYDFYQYKIRGVALEFMSDSLILLPKPVYGASANELAGKLLKLIKETQQIVLLALPELRLGAPECDFIISRRHVALESSEFAKAVEENIFVKNEMFMVDASKGVPEFEAHRPQFAEEDMRKFLDINTGFIKYEFSAEKFEKLWDYVGQSLENQVAVSKKIAELQARLVKVEISGGSTGGEGSVPVNQDNEDVR